MAGIDDLRDEYRRRRASATRKVGRTRRVNGVDLTGTQYDPRLPAGAERSLNSRQLRSQINKLNKFTARSNQFHAGRDGAVFTKNVWGQLKRVENLVGRIGNQEMARLSGLRLPSGSTIGEIEKEIDRTMGGASNRPFAPKNRRSQGFTSIKAVRKMIAHEQAKLDPNYKQKTIKSGRIAAEKMYKAMGMHAQAERVRKLDDERFYIAWNYGNLADETAIKYVSDQDPDIETSDPQGTGIDESIDWAYAIDLETYGDPNRDKPRKKKSRR